METITYFYGGFLCQKGKNENSRNDKKRDDKLLKNEKSWRRARIGAAILAVVWLIILNTVFKSFKAQQENEKILFFSIGWFLFWIVVIDWLNLRIGHIESITYYRSNKETS